MDVVRKMEANLGGTDISSPLHYICEEKLQDYKDISLAKTIFLLTDGFVDDKTTCLDIIAKSSETFRVQSLGVGQDFDRELIEKCGYYGKGSFSYIENVEQMKSIIIESLNKSLRNYLGDGKIVLPEKLSNYKYTYPKEIKVIFEDDVINYGFICPGEPIKESIEIGLTMTDYKEAQKKEIKQTIAIPSVEQLQEGDLLSRIIIGNILRKGEIDKEEDIKLSKEYQILSKNTSLFGEIEREDANTAEELLKVTYREIDKNPRKFKQPGMLVEFPPNFNFGAPTRIKHGDILPGGMVGIKEMGMVRKGNPIMKKKAGGMINSMVNLITNVFSRSHPEAQLDGCLFDKAKQFGVASSIKQMAKTCAPSIQPKSVSTSSTIPQKGTLDDFSELMVSQDIIEGSWNENDYTKKIMSMSDMKGIYEKIKANVSDGSNKVKICITVLILYYIFEKRKEKINEVKLIINKAKKFLMNNKVEYDTFITNIK